jgi:DNA invertase Pin-like site-specific DNA recombinase
MIQILTSISEMERTTIRQRIKSGYDSYINNGGKVGRKEGFKKDNTIFLNENKEIIKLLKQNYSVRNIMKITSKSSGTIQKVRNLLLNNNE